MEAFKSEHGVTYPLLIDPDNSVWGLYGQGYIPHNVVVDANRVVRYTEIGYSESDLLSTVQQYLPTAIGPYLRGNSFQAIDSEGNNNHRPENGETVNLTVNLLNHGLDATGVSATLSVNNPDIQITQNFADFGDVANDSTATNQSNPFSFIVNSTAPAHRDTFFLDIIADNDYAYQQQFVMIIGTSTIMLVDDDWGDSYEIHYQKTLDEKNIIPLEWNTLELSNIADEISKYETVIWFTGDARDNTLTEDEQAAIAAYLDAGGRLLISGLNIGYDLVENGSDSDSAFYANYLHADYVADSIKATWAMGVGGDIITGGMRCFFDGDFGGSENRTFPDVINPISPAESIFKYTPGSQCGGLRYEDESTGSKMVYLPFGFEEISGPREDSAFNLMEKILEWFAMPVSVNPDFTNAGLQKEYKLSQNYPNPFNPATKIAYELPVASQVTLKVYNLLGQEIRTLVNEIQAAGAFEVFWNGKDLNGAQVPGGIYLYKIQTEQFTFIRKMILLK